MVHDRLLLRVGAWSGLGYITIFGIGWLVLAHFMPPIAPTESAASVAATYADRHWAMLLASVFMMFSTFLLLPLGALCVLLVRRIEGGTGMLTLIMGFAFATLMVLNFYSGLAFELAAFRTDRPAALVQAADDAGFLQFMGGTPLFLAIWMVVAYAVLVTQRRGEQVMATWVGYLSLLVVVLYLPEVLVYLFKTGPFAWNGAVGFWIPAVLLIGYLVVSPAFLVPAVRRAFR